MKKSGDKNQKKIGCAPWQLDEPIWTITSQLCTNYECNSCSVYKICDRNIKRNVGTEFINSPYLKSIIYMAGEWTSIRSAL
ncbi:MAG: hypothetical protein ACXAEX_21360 [Promethearchaeota archaeon]